MKQRIIFGIVSFILLNSMTMSLAVNPRATETYALLIISPSQFTETLQPLVNHKINHGMSTILMETEEIYSTYEGRDQAEQIKHCIQYAYDTWQIQYVLLVGGRAPTLHGEAWLLPVRYSHIVDNWMVPEEEFISDLYFADIYNETGAFCSWDSNENGIFGEWAENTPAADIADLYPEVGVGRLACRNTFEVKIMVQKIISYEQQACDPAWFNKMVVVAGDTYTDNDYYEGEEITQQALDYMTGWNHVKLWTSDGSFSSWKDVVKTINKGCGFIFFAGHGSPGLWGTHPPFDDSTWIYGLKLGQMLLLRNSNKLPICVVGGCHNSLFNVSIFHSTWTGGFPIPECWSWWLTRKSGGGAIATLGCTGLGYGKEDKKHPEADGGGDLLNALFFKEYGTHDTPFLGDVWKNAIASYLDRYPIDWNQWAFNDTSLDAKTVQEWVLLGDPSLKIGGYA